MTTAAAPAIVKQDSNTRTRPGFKTIFYDLVANIAMMAILPEQKRPGSRWRTLRILRLHYHLMRKQLKSGAPLP